MMNSHSRSTEQTKARQTKKTAENISAIEHMKRRSCHSSHVFSRKSLRQSTYRASNLTKEGFPLLEDLYMGDSSSYLAKYRVG